ncbi:hypothetical protein M8J76_005053 [Diaphorina citri]|nr:hypothetical protein M8J76_005053 [Diaphorina citri]
MSTNADGEFSMQRMVIHAKNSKNYYLHSVAFENRTRAFENMRSDKQTTAYPILPILDKVVSIPANSLKMMVTNGNEDPALTTQHFGISEPNKSSAKDSKRQRRDQSQIFEMVSTVSRSPKQQLLENSGPNKSPANDIKGQQRDQNQIFEIISRPFSSFLMAKDWEISRKLWVPYSRVARQAVAGAISSIFFSFIFSIMRYFIRLILSYMFSFVGNIFTSGRPTT